MRILALTLVGLTACLCQARTVKILFLGNSHTANHDVPGMVGSLIQSGSKETKVVVKPVLGAFLDDLSKNPSVLKLIKEGSWDAVVLQGAKISSSHKYSYSQEPGITLAKLAINSGARVYLFAEWSRRGIDESDYTVSNYSQIAAKGGGKVVPVCRAFDKLLRSNPNAQLWSGDGNHSSLSGAYLAACALAQAIVPGSLGKANYAPTGLEPELARKMRSIAASLASN